MPLGWENRVGKSELVKYKFLVPTSPHPCSLLRENATALKMWFCPEFGCVSKFTVATKHYTRSYPPIVV